MCLFILPHRILLISEVNQKQCIRKRTKEMGRHVDTHLLVVGPKAQRERYVVKVRFMQATPARVGWECAQRSEHTGPTRGARLRRAERLVGAARRHVPPGTRTLFDTAGWPTLTTIQPPISPDARRD